MTEREYVETIRKAAEAYVECVRLDKGHHATIGAYQRWSAAKQNLSAPTAIALCDAWLTMQEVVE